MSEVKPAKEDEVEPTVPLGLLAPAIALARRAWLAVANRFTFVGRLRRGQCPKGCTPTLPRVFIAGGNREATITAIPNRSGTLWLRLSAHPGWDHHKTPDHAEWYIAKCGGWSSSHQESHLLSTTEDELEQVRSDLLRKWRLPERVSEGSRPAGF